MTKRLAYKEEIIETQDNKLWIYDVKHHCWIDVTMPNKMENYKTWTT